MKKKWIKWLVLLLVIAIVAVVAVVIWGKGYRVIKIEDFDGEVSLERGSDEKDIFEGMKLKSDDTLTTEEDGLLELLVDSDKHILAKENTCFTIQSTGNKKKGKLTIELEYGASLIEIENKLPDGYDVEVETPNASLSVRGTTFEVEYNKETKTTIVTVTEGKVKVVSEEDSVTVEAGEGAIVQDEEIIPVELNMKEDAVEIVLPGGNIYVEGILPEEDDDEDDKAQSATDEQGSTGAQGSTGNTTTSSHRVYLMTDDFPDLIKGGSSYDQMRYMIKIALVSDMNGHSDYLKEALFLMCHEGYQTDVFPPIEGTENVYDIDMLNNMFSFLTDEEIAEEHLNVGSTISGNRLTTYEDREQFHELTAIGLASMYYGENDEIIIEFIAEKHTIVDGMSGDILQYKGTAYLVQDETGKYVFDYLEWEER